MVVIFGAICSVPALVFLGLWLVFVGFTTDRNWLAGAGCLVIVATIAVVMFFFSKGVGSMLA
jgi:hypothetical protein